MKAFDCISYSLINAKIQTYGFNKDVFVLLYVFVTFKYFISDVLQGSIVGPVLVNLSPSDDAPSAFCLVSISNNEVTSKEK